jgi:hypothetical protein
VTGAIDVASPKPAAVLIAGEDISTASGLVPGAVIQAWQAPLLLTEAAGLALPPERPALVGASPGFG